MIYKIILQAGKSYGLYYLQRQATWSRFSLYALIFLFPKMLKLSSSSVSILRKQ